MNVLELVLTVNHGRHNVMLLGNLEVRTQFLQSGESITYHNADIVGQSTVGVLLANRMCNTQLRCIEVIVAGIIREELIRFKVQHDMAFGKLPSQSRLTRTGEASNEEEFLRHCYNRT